MAPKETDSSLKSLKDKFKKIELNDKLTAEALKSKLIRTSFDKIIIEIFETIFFDSIIVELLLSFITVIQKEFFDNCFKIVKAIIDDRIKFAKQVKSELSFSFEFLINFVTVVKYLKVHFTEKI